MFGPNKFCFTEVQFQNYLFKFKLLQKNIYENSKFIFFIQENKIFKLKK